MATSKIKLNGQPLFAKVIEKDSVSFPSGFSEVLFPLSTYLPSGTFVLGVATFVPNDYYIQGNISADNTNIKFHCQNTHTAAISGRCELTILYTM